MMARLIKNEQRRFNVPLMHFYRWFALSTDQPSTCFFQEPACQLICL